MNFEVKSSKSSKKADEENDDDAQQLIGQTLKDKYIVLRRIGKGATSRVFLVKDKTEKEYNI